MLSPIKKPTGFRKRPKPLPLPPEHDLRTDPDSSRPLDVKALPQRPLPPPPPSSMATLTIARRPVGDMDWHQHARGDSAISATSVYSDTPGMPQRLVEDEAVACISRDSCESNNMSTHESTDGDASFEASSSASGRRYSTSISSSHSSPPRPEIRRHPSAKSDRSVTVTDLKLIKTNVITAIRNQVAAAPPSSPPQQALPPLPAKHPQRLASLAAFNKRKPVAERPAPPTKSSTMGANVSRLFKMKSKDKLRSNTAPKDSETNPLPPSPKTTAPPANAIALTALLETPSSDMFRIPRRKILSPGHLRESSDTPTVTPENVRSPLSSATEAGQNQAVNNVQGTLNLSTDDMTIVENGASATDVPANPTVDTILSPSNPTADYISPLSISTAGTPPTTARPEISQSPISPQYARPRVEHQFTPLPLASRASRPSTSGSAASADQPVRPRRAVPRLPLPYSPSVPAAVDTGPRPTAQTSPGVVSGPAQMSASAVSNINDGPLNQPSTSQQSTLTASSKETSPRVVMPPFDKLTPAPPGMIVPAPKLKTHMALCFVGHIKMRPIQNNVRPVGCMMCEKLNREKRWSCIFCDLSCCTDCMAELARTKGRDLQSCLKRIGRVDRIPTR